MSEETSAERIARIMEIVEKMQKHGTVYKRLPAHELTKKRNFAALGSDLFSRLGRQASEDEVDLTKSYGIYTNPEVG